MCEASSRITRSNRPGTAGSSSSTSATVPIHSGRTRSIAPSRPANSCRRRRRRPAARSPTGRRCGAPPAPPGGAVRPVPHRVPTAAAKLRSASHRAAHVGPRSVPPTAVSADHPWVDQAAVSAACNRSSGTAGAAPNRARNRRSARRRRRRTRQLSPGVIAWPSSRRLPRDPCRPRRHQEPRHRAPGSTAPRLPPGPPVPPFPGRPLRRG